MFQDIRFALRMIRRAPGFAFLAILCLTLDIGANTAVFSWIEGILLRPFPAVARQDRLLVLGGTARGASRIQAVSWPDFLDLRIGCTSFESFIADRMVATTLSIGDRAERAPGSVVSANYFLALGVRPVLGRGFLPEEDFGRDAHPVTVISPSTVAGALWFRSQRNRPQPDFEWPAAHHCWGGAGAFHGHVRGIFDPVLGSGFDAGALHSCYPEIRAASRIPSASV
jgi:hypothetical protein